MNCVVVFGSSGMLGKYVVSYLKKQNVKCYCANRDTFDIAKNVEHINDFMDLFVQQEYDEYNIIVVNCAGIIPQSGNDNYVDTVRVNTIFPQLLFKWCEKHGIPMIHITTDCVFSGLHDTGYNEDTTHDPCDLYGITKSLGEPLDSCVIRTSIIGHQLDNKDTQKGKKSLLQWMKDNKEEVVNGYIDHYWNGVTCLQLSKIIYKMINKNLYWTGVRHIHTTPFISKFELLTHIKQVYNLKTIITPKITYKIDRSLKSCYITNSKLKLPNIYDQLVEQKNYIIC